MPHEQSPTPLSEKARLNDEFRKRNPPEDFYTTPGVRALPDVPGLVKAVQAFDAFTEGNDPYQEHDFGAIDWHKEKTFWKIDVYDRNLQYGAEDPLSPDARRVLTMMLASEY